MRLFYNDRCIRSMSECKTMESKSKGLLIAKYKFDCSKADLFPEFNEGFEYVYIDEQIDKRDVMSVNRETVTIMAYDAKPDEYGVLTTEYEVETPVLINAGDIVTRSIYSNKLPTKIRFSIGTPESTDYDGREKALLELLYLNNSNLITEEQMFQLCINLTKVDGFVSNKMHNISHMFVGCYNLTTVNVSNWDVSEVKLFNYFAYDCHTLKTLNVSTWDTGNAIEMNHMFYDCYVLDSLDVSNWNTGKVTKMNNIFRKCYKLTSLDTSNWDTSNVTRTEYMFYDCNNLTSLDVSNFDTSNVTDMSYMFCSCKSLTSLDVSNFDTSNVTNMFNMFGTCTLLTKIEGLESFNTSKVTNMGQLFMGCTALTELDLSRFDVSKVTNIDYIFQFDNVLTKLNLSNWHIQPDVRVEVPFMETMTFTIFTNCYELTNIIMNYSDCDSINKIISVLPTRTTDSMGTLNIVGVDDINQVDTEAAESKYWNII